jgi:hypothetical protein
MNKGAGAKAAWHVASRQVLQDLNQLFGSDTINLLPFEEGEAVRETVLATFDACRRAGTVSGRRFADKAQVRLFAGSEMAKYLESDITIFLQDSERRGVFRSDQRSVLRHLVEILEYDGSCVFLSDGNGTAGVLLDRDADNLSSPYEVEAWSAKSPMSVNPSADR